MIGFIDALLDRITMYRLMVFYLGALLAAAFALSIFQILPVDPLALATSTVLITATSLASNFLVSRLFRAPPNWDSVYITALILILLLDPAPPSQYLQLASLAFAALAATLSKYALAFRRKHVFNPAALGAVLVGVVLDQSPSWWAGGNLPLMPLVVVGGVLVVRKLRRGDLVASFVVATLAASLVAKPLADAGTAIYQAVVYSPLFFVAFVMLTEPLTTPPRRWARIAYGALVGILSAPTTHFGSFYLTPELALVLGNLFSYAASPVGRLQLTLTRIEQTGASVYDFVFRPERKLAFQAGQFVEVALDLQQGDSRGNRRYFTIASSPTENELRLGIKLNPEPSAFKLALTAMKPGDTLYAGQLGGEFTLPADPDRKLAFLAGGVGITPFRSMIKYLLDKGEARSIVVLYGAERAADLAYRDIFDRAERELGVKTDYILANESSPETGFRQGLLSEEIVRDLVPDFLERTFYVSGPLAMVEGCKRVLHAMGVKHHAIKVDFFPGFAPTHHHSRRQVSFASERGAA